MKCKLIHFFYRFFPGHRWKVFLIESHYLRCRKCSGGIPPDEQIKSLLISDQDVPRDPRFWSDIREAVTGIPKAGVPAKTKPFRLLFPKWQWITATLIVLLLLVAIPRPREKKSSGTVNAPSKKQFVLTSIKMEDIPAKTYIFQSKNPNRLIIWVKKSKTGGFK